MVIISKCMTLFQKQSVRLKDLIEYHTVFNWYFTMHTYFRIVYAHNIKM